MGNIYGGVETGGTWVVCALGTGPDDIVAQDTFATGEPGSTLARIAEFFERGPRPAAIGVGSFGPVDLDPDSPTWGHVTTTPKPGWAHASVAPVLAERLGLPVYFDTDVTTAALAEQRWGAATAIDSVCYLTVGTGIGAGLLIDGRPVHGLVHPEVGHLRIPHDRGRDPFPGACPAHGDCWEGLAAGGALRDRWGRDPREIPDEHPAWALEAEYVALGILAIVFVVSPRRMVVGGGVMERPGLLEVVRARLVELNAGYLETPLMGADIDRYVVAPALGDRAGVLGAIALAQDAAG
ncbi:MAG: ROK family protein [Solirubrobacteraceae bacterium]